MDVEWGHIVLAVRRDVFASRSDVGSRLFPAFAVVCIRLFASTVNCAPSTDVAAWCPCRDIVSHINNANTVEPFEHINVV